MKGNIGPTFRGVARGQFAAEMVDYVIIDRDPTPLGISR